METIVPTSAVKIVFRWQCAIKFLERVENAKLDGTVNSAMKVSSSLKESIREIVCAWDEESNEKKNRVRVFLSIHLM